MANTLLTSTIVTKESGFGYTNAIRFVGAITHKYDDYFLSQGRAGKVGDTVQVRQAIRLEPKTGQAYQPQALYEYSVPVTMDKQFQVAFGWGSAEATLSIEEVKERYIDRAVATLANQVDVYAYDKVFRDVFNIMGTPGTVPSAFLTYTTAVVKLVNQAVDDRNICATLSPLSMATIANANAALFHPSNAVTNAYRNGMQSPASGIKEFFREPNVQSYTTGTFTASTPFVNGASQTGSSLITDGWASGATTLNKGDTFTIAGVNTLNPLSYTDTAMLQDFVVTSTISDTTGDMTIAISPSIIVTGALRTVSASPANNAVITVRGATSAAAGTLATTTSPQNLVFHKEFATFVTVDLLKPAAGVDCRFFRAAGTSMRFLEGYDIINDQNPSRLDILGGAATLQARGACRVAS